MVKHELHDLLDGLARQVEIPPPPTAEILKRVSHRRRRRMRVRIAAVGATIGLAGAASWVAVDGTEFRRVTPNDKDSFIVRPSGAEVQGTWRLTSLRDANGVALPVQSQGRPATLSLEDGKFTGTTGCNLISGSFRLGAEGNSTIVFPSNDLLSGAGGCQDEPPVLSRLPDVRQIERNRTSLTLRDEAGRLVATFKPVT